MLPQAKAAFTYILKKRTITVAGEANGFNISPSAPLCERVYLQAVA